jgi:hypothetical protein
MGETQLCSFSLYCRRPPVTCGIKSTLYSAAVASPATARLACECGLAIRNNNRLQVMGGLLADLETLHALRQLGMPLFGDVVRAVAQSGRLHILQLLGIGQKFRIPRALGHWAARSGNIDMLNWLRAEGLCAFTAEMCSGAAEGGHLAALQHLRNEGCDWDVNYIGCLAARAGSIKVVDWLLQEQA